MKDFSVLSSGLQGLGLASAPCRKVPCLLSDGTHSEQQRPLGGTTHLLSTFKSVKSKWLRFFCVLFSQFEFVSFSFAHRKLLWQRRAKCLSHGRIHLHLFIWSITSLMWPTQRCSWQAGRLLLNRLDRIPTGMFALEPAWRAAAVNVFKIIGLYCDGKRNWLFF